MRTILATILIAGCATSADPTTSAEVQAVCTNDDAECCAQHPDSPNCAGPYPYDYGASLETAAVDMGYVLDHPRDTGCDHLQGSTICHTRVLLVVGPRVLVCKDMVTHDPDGTVHHWWYDCHTV